MAQRLYLSFGTGVTPIFARQLNAIGLPGADAASAAHPR
jgi:hypothetical protein